MERQDLNLITALWARCVGESLFMFLSEGDLSRLRITSRQIGVDILDSLECRCVWSRFYDNCLHVSPNDADVVLRMTPRETFFHLTKLNMTGKWSISGQFTEQESDTSYTYVQSFKELKKNAPLIASFEGNATEQTGASFKVEGKRVGNNIIMYETVFESISDRTPMAVNVCSAVLSIDGTKLSGVWMQHYRCRANILSAAVVSGVFEGARIASTPDSVSTRGSSTDCGDDI